MIQARFVAAVAGLGLVLLGLAFCSVEVPAQDSGGCAPYLAVEKDLWLNWGERPIATANGLNGQVLVVFAAEDGATWTVVNVKGTMACWVDGGLNWQAVEWAPMRKGV